MIFTIGGIKGGSGKTTIATNLTIYLSQQGHDVLLVDADEQETASDFTAWREDTLTDTGYTLVKLTGESVRREVLKLSTKYDQVVIDTGGRDTTSQRAALAVSDVYLLPFNPRSFDIWTLTKVEKLLAEVQAIKPTPIQAMAFLNRADVRGSDNAEAAGQLASSALLTYLPQAIVNRKAFSHAQAKGLSVTEMELPDEKAKGELLGLFAQIMASAMDNNNV